jgi:hypothetical protein
MATQKPGKLNSLGRLLPEGLLVDAAWMEHHGYSTSLRSQYVSAGWLLQPVRGTYKRPRGELTWQKVIVSMQTLLGSGLSVGGRTALDLLGFSHFLSRSAPSVVHLYGTAPPPGWLAKLPLLPAFRFHRSQTLFRMLPETRALQEGTLRHIPVASEWQLTISTPERALLEMLDELPGRESFPQVDLLMEGLGALSPRRLQLLLEDCSRVKVKRLFFWFAARHPHAWAKQVDRSKVDLGTGKRSLVKGGRLDPDLLITVPEDLDAHV